MGTGVSGAGTGVEPGPQGSRGARGDAGKLSGPGGPGAPGARAPKPRRTLAQRLSAAVAALALVVGVGLLLYPVVGNLLYQANAFSVISSYDASVGKLSQAELDALWAEAEDYNYELGHPEVKDPWGYEEVIAPLDRYWDVLDPDGTGVMGYVEVPTAGVNLPMYHGTGDDVLEKGIGHIATTALPVGGESTHPVVTGHTGLPDRMLFTNLTLVKKGDVFRMHVLGRTLSYKVTSIDVVEPTDTSLLQPIEGEEYVTLLTCTPYGINSHRLLVTGVPTTEEPPPTPGVPIEVLPWLLLLAAMFAVGIVAAAAVRRSAKRSAPAAHRAVRVIGRGESR